MTATREDANAAADDLAMRFSRWAARRVGEDGVGRVMEKGGVKARVWREGAKKARKVKSFILLLLLLTCCWIWTAQHLTPG